MVAFLKSIAVTNQFNLDKEMKDELVRAINPVLSENEAKSLTHQYLYVDPQTNLFEHVPDSI